MSADSSDSNKILFFSTSYCDRQPKNKRIIIAYSYKQNKFYKYSQSIHICINYLYFKNVLIKKMVDSYYSKIKNKKYDYFNYTKVKNVKFF